MAKIDDSVKKKVPELQFKGFTDEWEERKLKDIAQFNPKTVLPDEFEYVDLESVVGTEMISHRTESKDQAPSRAQRLAQKGDVFYQTVRPYQMNNYLYDLPYDNYVFSTGYAQMRPNIDSYFLLNSVQNKQFVQHVLDRSTGTSYPAINSSDLSNIEIHVPSKLSEQQKIGAFFQSIDDTIALHQHKLDLLKEQKKGYLQKMFPKNGAKVPELRFAGFADAWEQRKLIEVADYRNGKAHEKDISENGDYIVVNSKFVSTNGAVKKFSDELIAPLKKGELAFVLSDVPNGRAIARTFLIDEDNKYSLNQRIAGITPHSDTNSYFLHSLMNRHHYFLRFDDGAGQTNLSKKEVENWTELYPSIEEQDKIGSFFKQLDDTITLHQRKLDLLKEQKKGFLQKMFV
ncbi:restriction endonuclease subunit S [Pediococcus ethanolidurans]|uniref:restriction endonuclease subunit S n=1 Tax=Pediococcus ethanolidurans TaxID=319653 RepID=UPI0021E734A0|nr:restriction endonuclease subunit S [Pediococcus ethanolidurans]MCV3328321.1 restriction endonuclease subunit S [Pediococcus ethanolidurans]